MFVEWAVADHDPGRVDPDISSKSFELGGVAPELLISGTTFDELLQFRFRFVLVLEFDIGFCLNHLGNAVAFAVGNPHDATDIAQYTFRT